MKIEDLEFKAEDFEPHNAAGFLIPEQCARIANQRLRERLGKAEIIYGRRRGDKIIWVKPEVWRSFGTHQAYLVGERPVAEPSSAVAESPKPYPFNQL